jgi:hypothetical protein
MATAAPTTQPNDDNNLNDCQIADVLYAMGCSLGLENLPTTERRKQEAGGTVKENKFLYFFMSLSQKARMFIGHQFNKTILNCRFRGHDCTDEE